MRLTEIESSLSVLENKICQPFVCGKPSLIAYFLKN